MVLSDYIEKQIEWSKVTFKDHPNIDSILDHIRKELKEIEQNPTDPYEWIDLIILAIEGAWRIANLSEHGIEQYLIQKQLINKQRNWPDVTTFPKGKAIEHV